MSHTEYKPGELAMIGNAAILDRPKISLFCSAKCPGKLILDTYDLAKKFRERGVTVISGFHSPMEEECLRNRLVADLADAVVVAHAAPGSKMEVFCRELLAAGKPVYTFDHPANASLLTAGAINVDQLP
jgi:predicted Rossmann fold nucleotide-binding protein DprA/Smf involved in DNA uptake